MSIKQEIQEIVSKHGKLTAREIAAKMGRKYSTWFRGHLIELVDSGVLERKQIPVGSGRRPYIYRIAKAKGRSFYKEWQAYCLTQMPLPYDMWLEIMLEEERKNGGGS